VKESSAFTKVPIITEDDSDEEVAHDPVKAAQYKDEGNKLMTSNDYAAAVTAYTTRLLTHSLTYLLTHLLTRSLTPTHSLTHSLTTHSLTTHSLTYSLTH
jgi:hypothetical protein